MQKPIAYLNGNIYLLNNNGNNPQVLVSGLGKRIKVLKIGEVIQLFAKWRKLCE